MKTVIVPFIQAIFGERKILRPHISNDIQRGEGPSILGGVQIIFIIFRGGPEHL